MHKRQGFTIVELLIVIVVIAVLVSIVLVSYSGIQRRASESASANAVSTAGRKIEAYKVINSIYPATLSDAGVSSSTVQYEYSQLSSGTGYCVTATLNDISMYQSNAVGAPQTGACPGHAVQLTNYALNPSVEAGSTGGWSDLNATAGYTFGISSAQAYTGTKSYSVIAPSTVSDAWINLDTTVTKAATYYVSAYVYITSSNNSFVGGTANGREAMWNLGPVTGWVWVTYDRAKLNQWQRIQAVATVTTPPATMSLRFYPPAGGTMYVDSVMISDGQSAYADGSSSGWSWAGSANASTSSGKSK